MSPTILFTYLKIILLQYFQFSVFIFSNNKLNPNGLISSCFQIIKNTFFFFRLFCKQILGVGMSEKMWEVTIKHARTCVLGNKQYILRGNNHFVMFNPICQVLKAVIDGQDYTSRELSNIDRV